MSGNPLTLAPAAFSRLSLVARLPFALATAIAFVSVTASIAPLPAQERVAFRHLTIADGLSQNAVSAIVQDRRGFMWFGTKDGLNRYDGYEFVVFRHDPFDSTSISDSEITVLFEDGQGRLWVGTRGGGLNRFDRNREQFERLVLAPARTITAIAEDAAGAIWVGSLGEGLYRLTIDSNDGAVTAVRFVHSAADPSSVSDDRIRALLVDRRGVLWVGTDAGLDQRESNSATGVTLRTSRRARAPRSP